MTPLDQRDSGWIDCAKCHGTGVWHGTKVEGAEGPCFLCNGTGDGRIQNWTAYRQGRGRWQRRNGGKNGTTPVVLPTPPIESMPTPIIVPTAPAQTAAEHLAAALAAMQQSAPIDADMVREILANEFSIMGDVLSKTIETARDAHARLRDAIAGIPQRMVIEVGNHMGELPAMRHRLTDEILMFVAQNVPVYLVGGAGSGKTTAAHQIADALGLPFYLQGAMAGSHEILGYCDAYGKYQTTPYRQAFEHGGILLLDEIDASDAGALLAANAGIANGHMSFPDSATPVKRHADFRLIAAANTFGHGADRQYVGRNPLDAATLDRFAFVEWTYDETLERQFSANDEWITFVQNVRAAISKLALRYVVSPRATIMGSKMLAAGMARERVESALIWKGMKPAEIDSVRGAL